jgi:GTPase SAR1 family protein
MKIIHKDGFSDEERSSYRSIVYNNVVSAMRALVRGAMDLNCTLDNQDVANRLLEGNEEYFSGPLSSQVVEDIRALWKDSGIREAYKQSHKFQLIDSAEYYFENLDRIASADYVPNEQDVLRSRAKTTGIIEIEFQVEKTHFRMVDVGGQRSERKKWMHCFQDVTAVIFCVAMSEYNLLLQEDDSTNRMQESLKLFKEICNSKWFTDTAMILFLNKKDLFEEKIKEFPLEKYFESYSGGPDYEKASGFIRDMFVNQNEVSGKVIYPHCTCATDTNNIQVVFNAVKDIILRQALNCAGII